MNVDTHCLCASSANGASSGLGANIFRPTYATSRTCSCESAFKPYLRENTATRDYLQGLLLCGPSRVTDVPSGLSPVMEEKDSMGKRIRWRKRLRQTGRAKLYPIADHITLVPHKASEQFEANEQFEAVEESEASEASEPHQEPVPLGTTSPEDSPLTLLPSDFSDAIDVEVAAPTPPEQASLAASSVPSLMEEEVRRDNPQPAPYEPRPGSPPLPTGPISAPADGQQPGNNTYEEDRGVIPQPSPYELRPGSPPLPPYTPSAPADGPPPDNGNDEEERGDIAQPPPPPPPYTLPVPSRFTPQSHPPTHRPRFATPTVPDLNGLRRAATRQTSWTRTRVRADHADTTVEESGATAHTPPPKPKPRQKIRAVKDRSQAAVLEGLATLRRGRAAAAQPEEASDDESGDIPQNPPHTQPRGQPAACLPLEASLPPTTTGRAPVILTAEELERLRGGSTIECKVQLPEKASAEGKWRWKCSFKNCTKDSGREEEAKRHILTHHDVRYLCGNTPDAFGADRFCPAPHYTHFGTAVTDETAMVVKVKDVASAENTKDKDGAGVVNHDGGADGVKDEDGEVKDDGGAEEVKDEGGAGEVKDEDGAGYMLAKVIWVDISEENRKDSGQYRAAVHLRLHVSPCLAIRTTETRDVEVLKKPFSHNRIADSREEWKPDDLVLQRSTAQGPTATGELNAHEGQHDQEMTA
ncbi:hypothetical protein JB92DRAFT_3274391 [Gautieria morchelliformis]|nr:hypothetical protein JB92DRAFT_3274391 [Gautieria morchelliformis]